MKILCFRQGKSIEEAPLFCYQQWMQTICKNIRKSVLKMVYQSGSSHIGSAFSIVEALVALYFKVLNIDPKNPQNPRRDKFILSKAHASAALYAVLAERGFFEKNFLDGYCMDGGTLPGHLDRLAAPGIETSGGSLGHGLGLGIGMALAARHDGGGERIFVLLGDGECNEGSVWEAFMLAPQLKLDNLVAIVDFNFIQSLGRTNEIINQANLCERLAAFGWDSITTDGHNIETLVNELTKKTVGRPRAIVMHTVKGKGVSFMEDSLVWHYRSPRENEFIAAMKELA